MSLSMEENGGSSSEDGKNCSRGHWRPAEDDKLKQLVEQFGPRNWNSIAEHIEGRTGKSCRLRWFNQLDPRINRKPFSEEEEERLLGAHRRYGNKWSLIARLFPGRTDNAVKNHYHVIIARQHRERPKRNDGNNDSNSPSTIFGKARRPRSETYDSQLGFMRPVTRQEDDKFSYILSTNMRKSTWFNFREQQQQPMSSRWQPLFGTASSIAAWDLDLDRSLDKQIIHSDALSSINNVVVPNKQGFRIDHQQRRVDANSFRFSHLGIGYQSLNKKNADQLGIPFTANSSGNMKQPRAVQLDHQSSDESSVQRKDVPFIDFLGVGIAS